MYKIFLNSTFISELDSLESAKEHTNYLFNDFEVEPNNTIKIVKTVKKKKSLAGYTVTVYCTGKKNGRLTFSRPIKQKFNVS